MCRLEVGSESVPAVDPLSLLVQHLLPLTPLRPSHPTHPGVGILRVLATPMTFDLLPGPEDGGGEGREGGRVAKVTPRETEDGLGDGHG